MKWDIRNAVKKVSEVLVVTYAAACALVCIPFAVIISFGRFPLAPQTTAELKPLYYSVIAFISVAFIALVCVMAKGRKQKVGETDVAG